MSFDGVSKYRKILDAVEANVKTDLTWDDMMDINQNICLPLKQLTQNNYKDTVQPLMIFIIKS